MLHNSYIRFSTYYRCSYVLQIKNHFMQICFYFLEDKNVIIKLFAYSLSQILNYKEC